jgi:hypothetical protein
MFESSTVVGCEVPAAVGLLAAPERLSFVQGTGRVASAFAIERVGASTGTQRGAPGGAKAVASLQGLGQRVVVLRSTVAAAHRSGVSSGCESQDSALSRSRSLTISCSRRPKVCDCAQTARHGILRHLRAGKSCAGAAELWR